MLTCRFGVRRYPNGRSAACYEVFDRITGKTVASALSRVEVEADARRRNDDSSGEAVELRGLRATIDALVTEADHQWPDLRRSGGRSPRRRPRRGGQDGPDHH